MRIGRDKVEEILHTADLVEVIGEYVQLKRRGSSYVGLSPFKPEKSPSFYVTPSKNIYKDFSSGKGGDVISFLMEKEGFSFTEALRHLAQRYNIELPEEDGSGYAPDQEARLQSLRIYVQFAADWYRQQMYDTEDGRIHGLSYFRERGFNDQTLKDFHLGYAPDAWDGLSKASTAAQYNPEIVRESGLVKESEKSQGRLFDLLRDRVIFPLHDALGRIVGIAGRVLTATSDGVKYINSPESQLYKKSQILYGMHLAKDAIRLESECLLAEGYTDVMRLHQEGIRHAVASAGTAFTQEQARLIARFSRSVTILYDGDKAGIAATLRAADILLAEGFMVNCLLLPDGHDPDSYLKAYGGATFRAYLREKRQNFLAYRLGVSYDAQNTQDPNARARLVHEVVDVLALIPDDITRGVYVQEAASLLSVPLDLVANALDQKLRQRRLKEDTRIAQVDARAVAELQQPGPTTQALPPSYYRERELIRLLLNYYDRNIEQDEGQPMPFVQFLDFELLESPFQTEAFAQIRTAIFDAFHASEPLPVHKLLHEMGDTVCELVSDLMTPKYALSHNWWEKREIATPPLDDDLLLSALGALQHLDILQLDKLEHQNRQEIQANELAQAQASPEDLPALQEQWEKLMRRHIYLMERRRQPHADLGIVVKGGEKK
jgi:DNA primase